MNDDTRERLLDAVEHLMRTRGLARISTRAIAQRAGLAEGALYNHFNDKIDLFIAVIQRNVAELSEVLHSLPLRVGQDTIRHNIEMVAKAAFAFHQRVAPLICSMMADQELLARNRRALQVRQIGPERSVKSLALYIAAEQRLGRVGSGVDPDAIAQLLLGATFHAAVADQLVQQSSASDRSNGRMSQVVTAILRGLEPRAARSTAL